MAGMKACCRERTAQTLLRISPFVQGLFVNAAPQFFSGRHSDGDDTTFLDHSGSFLKRYFVILEMLYDIEKPDDVAGIVVERQMLSISLDYPESWPRQVQSL